MTVYVDELRRWPTTIACFRGGSCHLTADSLDELHAFAARIGLRRSWAQLPPEHRIPHYDLTAGRREAALAAGAVEVSARVQASRRIAERAVYATVQVPREHLHPVGSSAATLAARGVSPPPHPRPRDEAPVLALPASGAVGDDEREPERGPGSDEVG